MKYISHEENKTGLYLTVSYRRWYWPFGIVTRTVFSKRHAPWNNWFDLDTGKRFGDDPKLTAIWNAACQREAKLLHEIEELDKQIAAEEKKAAAKFDLPKKPAAEANQRVAGVVIDVAEAKKRVEDVIAEIEATSLRIERDHAEYREKLRKYGCR